MKKILLLVIALCSGSHLGSAAEFQALPKPSNFGTEKILRDPFEPLHGAQAPELSVQLGSDGVDEAQLAAFFKVTAISIDRLSIALVNGTAVAEGESFSVRTRQGKMRLRMLKVKQNGVVLKSSGTIFNVPLSR